VTTDNGGAAAVAAPGAGAGVIHDLGYRHYDGPRLGRAGIIRALYWHSLRSAFGIGRGAKAKIVPVLAFIILCTPAVINAVAMALGHSHTRIIDYDTYDGPLRVLVILVFIAAQAPELVARDLRSRVLPLYFARPIRRTDYPAAKYAAFVLALLAMIDIPVLLLYIGTIMQLHTGTQIWLQTKALIPGLLVGLMWSVLLAAVGLALACVSGRRAFSTGSVAIFLFLTYTLASVLTKIVEAPGPGGPGGPGGPRGPGGPGGPGSAGPHTAVAVGHAPVAVPASAHLFGLISPFTVVDGVRQWLGGTNPGIVADPGSKYGLYYGLMFLVFLGASLAALAARYRSVSVA
jgi:ABC-2 type transport system permease protein